MKKALPDPDHYCPICGVKLQQNEFGTKGHECNATTLRRIAAARKRDYVQMRQPSEQERIKDGFAMIDNDGYSDDADEPDPE